jgi:hypothetical protein
MRFGKLRIAWSVFWGVACVLLICSWVRSYRWVDGVKCYRPMHATYFLVSASKELRLEIIPDSNPPNFSYFPSTYKGVHRLSVPPMRDANADGYCRVFNAPASGDPDRLATSIMGFRLVSPPAKQLPVIPHWFAVSLFGVLAVAPWRRSSDWRFSLRTLLIATTLVAVVLGLVVWAASR